MSGLAELEHHEDVDLDFKARNNMKTFSKRVPWVSNLFKAKYDIYFQTTTYSIDWHFFVHVLY